MANKPLTLTVDTGAVQYDVVDTFGDKIGVLKFNPSDSGLLSRYESVINYLNGVSFDENLTDDQTVEKVRTVDNDLRGQFDYLLGNGAADGLFSTCGPLSVIANGDFYFEHILESVGNIVEQTTNKRVEKKLARVKKATAKYDK